MPDFLPSWISTEQFAVLTEILEAMNQAQLPFQATGGLAGNLHGSVWPLHDLDFDVAPPLLSRMATEFRAQVVYGPAPFRDEEFALDLLTLRFGSVDVADLMTLSGAWHVPG